MEGLPPGLIREKYKRFVQLNPEFEKLLLPDNIPFERFKVYERWKPDTVEVLLIAESPPWKESVYFYNEHSHGGLSESIFNHLGIRGESKSEKLREFRRRRLFLVDTIKCVYRKNARPSIPKKLIMFSAQEILQQEIENLNPQTILCLGATALAGLKHTERFSNPLSGVSSVLQTCGKSVKIGEVRIIISVFPNDRNRPHEKAIRSAFAQISTQDSSERHHDASLELR